MLQKKPTFHYHLFGRSIYAPYYYDRNNIVNKLAAILNRAGRYHEYEMKFSSQEKEKLKSFFSTFLYTTNTEITLDHARKYIQAKSWPNWKKKQWIMKTQDFIDHVSNSQDPGLYMKYGVNHDLFIKDECYYESNKAPRMIFDAQASIKASGALYLESLAESFFHSKYSVKHLPMDERVEEIKRRSIGYSYFVRMDYSSYESSICAKAQEFEWELYQSLGVSAPEAKRLASLPHRKVCDRSFTAILTTCRMSGDFNTSLGNSLLNLSAIFVCCEKLHIDFDVIVEGDDALLMTRQDPSGLKQELYYRGLDADFQVYDDPGKAGFCGLRFDAYGRYFDQEKIFRHLLVSHPNNLSREEYKSAVIRSALDLDPTNPILHELHSRHPGDFSASWDRGEGIQGQYVGGFYLVRGGELKRPDFFAYQQRTGFPKSDILNWMHLPDLNLIECVLYNLGARILNEVWTNHG